MRKLPSNNGFCRWLTLSIFFMTYSGATVATEAKERLIRGLWTLTTQSDPIRPVDVQRALSINANHYVSKPGSQSWDTIYSLAEQYRNETAPGDPVADIYIGLGEFVVLEGPPRDVGTRQKVKIILMSSTCVSAESMQAVAHSARAAATPLQFKNETGRTQSSLDLDADCSKSVLISKLFTPSPLPAKSAP
jgi:hypothetical protein